jgi:hypothetical protein
MFGIGRGIGTIEWWYVMVGDAESMLLRARPCAEGEVDI